LTKQTEKDIVSRTGLSGIRAQVSMYAGSSDSDGMWTAIREPLDNCLDEVFAGRNSSVCLIRDTRHANAFWIIDQGGGIPVGNITIDDPINHKKIKISALKGIVSLTHTGGKFNLSLEAGQRGTHGAGLKLTNAVSTEFTCTTFRDGGWYTTSYAKGKVVKDVGRTTAPKVPNYDGKITKGTVIYANLDSSVFDKGSKVPEDAIRHWFTMSSAFSDGVEFSYFDGNEWVEWESAGPTTYLEAVIAKQKATLLADDATLTLRGKFWDVAVSFTNYDGAGLQGFTNGLPNIEGGTHVTTVYTVIAKVIMEYAKRGQTFTPSDFREGMLGAVNMRLTGCKFHNQAKSKLVDERATDPLAEELTPLVEAFFAKHKALAALLCERASTLASLKQDFQQSKRVLKTLKDAKKKGTLPSKLAASMSCSNEDRELYIVEGDSAGGSAKYARDSSFQEVLPLKGKIPNAFKEKNAIENEEILNLLTAIGYDPSQEDPFKSLRVGKVIILTDSDLDGLHIQNLIISCFVRYVPQLINEGRVYFVMPYEFLVQYKGKYHFAATIAELQKMVPESAHKSFMHLKGLGEVNAPVLADMAFSLETRRLIKLEPLTRQNIKRISELAGQDTAARKELLGV